MQSEFNRIEDLIADENFISWVLKTGGDNDEQWNAWVIANPDKAALVQQAAEILQQLRIQEKELAPKHLEAAEAKLFSAIENEKNNQQAKVIPIQRRKWWYAAAAAVVAGMIWFGISNSTEKKPAPQLATAYGQVQQHKLPDGSEVILNANSNVSFKPNWKEGTDREVWIKGEAFFHVKKTEHRDKFTVHTNAFDIEVTGTSFNVINRDDKSTIILKEGSVIIHRKGSDDIKMAPGDVVEFSNRQIQKKTTQKTDYLAWTENKLVFDNTYMKEVAADIELHYGVKVFLKGDGISEKAVTGILPNNNLNVLLQSLEASLDVDIKQSGNTITISNRN